MFSKLDETFLFAKGLGFRLAALLSVAILPIGLMSLIQTMYVSGEAARSAQTAIVGRTAAAAAGERALLQSALGTADALGPAVLPTLDDPAACSRMLRSFVERGATYQTSAYVPLSGVSTCNSGESTTDLRRSSAFESFIANPTTMVVPLVRGKISGLPVVLVAQPLYRDRELLGYVSVSLSQELLRSTHSTIYGSEGARTITFNSEGDIISADEDALSDIGAALPRNETLRSLISRAETTFSDRTLTGEDRVFAVVSVIPGLVYALGSFSPQEAGVQGYQVTKLTAVMFAVVLWAVSLGVAYYAVYRLVLRHVRELRGQMRRFAVGDRAAAPRIMEDAPTEIADVSRTFYNMVRILNRDEAALEAAIDEKTVLLKEVHHRVKNNLQLIASIISMQGRVIEDDDAKRVLRSVQDRVASLASIYKNLYQAEHLESVSANRLVSEIISQMTRASSSPDHKLKVDTHLEPLVLQPDQAVPLTLLTNEAFTNALKYAGTPPGHDHAWVRVRLTREDDEHARLEVTNSIGELHRDPEGTGLGSQLIEAFAEQLEGKAVVHSTDTEYTLSLVFHTDEIRPLPIEDRKVVLTSAAREGSRH
ncbi:histidine kinase dimerization/phosphoacceptor domain -containing protein [Paracoccus sp. SCSIO 75233]|uniref:histidine kinase dimerization/phosphoacceptor domain -containing protein n=1 Tax=Paracoccus sp. SCSIO 75233 TaxID=3017782 RepID=UPI0022F02256|nr:histidine kinase dimerization/phosphoacceptor domain -containing protein [Paracoccus sp. SCSIO 75233]WBU52908.1 histidine kinase [Paracoccus sp. SCSIO 75233]